MIRVGPKGSIPVSAPVNVPEKRPGERTVAVDVIQVFGALYGAGRAYFRAGFQPAGDREVTFKFGEPKAVNLRPGLLYQWRIEVPVDQELVKPHVAKGHFEGEYISPGQIVPGSRPTETATEPLRVFRGRFPMVFKDYVIQVRDDLAQTQFRQESLPPEEGSTF